MNEYKLTIEVTMLINEEMDMGRPVEEDIAKGNIQVTGFKMDVLDEHGNTMLDDGDDYESVFTDIIKSLGKKEA